MEKKTLEEFDWNKFVEHLKEKGEIDPTDEIETTPIEESELDEEELLAIMCGEVEKKEIDYQEIYQKINQKIQEMEEFVQFFEELEAKKSNGQKYEELIFMTVQKQLDLYYKMKEEGKSYKEYRKILDHLLIFDVKENNYSCRISESKELVNICKHSRFYHPDDIYLIRELVTYKRRKFHVNYKYIHDIIMNNHRSLYIKEKFPGEHNINIIYPTTSITKT